MMEYDNPMDGFKLVIDDNGKRTHTALVREGCSGSPACAMEWYLSKSTDFLHDPNFNVHFSDEEMEMMYRAIKAIRKNRKEGKDKQWSKQWM